MKNSKENKHKQQAYDENDKDIYSVDYIEELEENDEISLAEQGFMEGYMEA